MKDSRLCLQEIESTSSNMKRHNSWWKRRTFMEKKFCILIVFLLAVCVGMGVTAVWYYFTYIIPQLAMIKNAKTITTSTTTLTTTPETMTTKTELPPPNLCLTPGCVRAANRILESMNQKINPCDDFYEFVCGGFLQKTHIPDEKTSMSQFSRLHEDLTHQIKNLMEAEEKQDDFEIDRMVKDFYASCMNLTRISELGLAPLDKIIKEVGGWPVLMGIKWDATNLDWKTLMYRFSEVDFSTNFFVGLGIIRDFKNNSKHIFALVEPSTGFPYSYLKKGKNDSNVLDHLQFMVETAVFWGANREVAEKEMEDVLDFELKLLQILKDPNQKSKNISKIYNESTIAELYEMNADMNWSEYIKKLYPYDMDETEPIVVTLGQNFTSNFTKLYADTNIRILANYAIGRMVRSLTPFVSEEYGELHFEIFKKMSGIQQRPTRWKRCMAQTKSYFSTAIGSMYVDKFFKPEAKTMAIEMVDMIRAEMKDIINKVSWADPKTIKRAKEKLDAVVAHVAYPEELLDEEEMLGVYENYTISRLDFFDNVRSISRLDTTEYKQRLREPVKRNHWEKKSNVAVVNAFYNSLDNSISIPAGILQDVFFDFDRPQYMNFAAIGTVVGHELTHGFDNTGRQFDKDGHLLNWWEADTNERFIDRSQCMIDQYGNYTVPETGENLNGRNTLGENIADNGGLKESYYAYRTWAQHHEEEKLLPGVNYTINQLFWISYATIWCIKQRPEQAHLQIEFGVHSLGRFRVNGPLSNMQAFAEDFHCPLGSPLNPVSKCNVW